MVQQLTSSEHLNATFSALADPTRRAILARLASGETSVSELAEPGREAQWRPCRLAAAPLKDASDWLERYRRFWEEAFDRLDDYLRELQQNESKPKEKKNGRKKYPRRRIRRSRDPGLACFRRAASTRCQGVDRCETSCAVVG